jgi:hypothetical protein
LGRAGVWIRTLLLQSRCSTAWVTSPVRFGDRASWTICPGWPRTEILPISASHVARIMGVSHQCPAWLFFKHSPLLSLYVSDFFYIFEHISTSDFYFISIFGSSGIWTQDLALARQGSTPWAMHPAQ